MAEGGSTVLRDGRNLRFGERRSRLGAAVAALAIEGGIAAALIFGLAPPDLVKTAVEATLTAVDLTRKPNAPEPRARSGTYRKSGAAAHASAVGRASPVFAAPSPITPVNPLPAAIRAGQDQGPGAGTALVAGSGNAGGGTGLGSGSGSGGAGMGNGDGDGGTEPDWIGGKIRNADYPLAARAAHVSGTTQTSISVSADGRPTQCRVTRGSGSRELDEVTCRLVLQRFRFRAARNSAAQAVAGEVDYDQEWDAPPPPPDQRN